MKHLVVVIDWYGPYSLEKAILAVNSGDYEMGLYMCLGKLKGKHGPSKIQYVGIAGKDLKSRLNDNHAKLQLVTRDRKIWLGEVGSLGVPGKKKKKTNPALDFSEWAFTYFVKPALNQKKKITPPAKPVTVLCRWWKTTGYDKAWTKRPHPDWPDLIDYLGPGYKAKLVWFKSPKRIFVE